MVNIVAALQALADPTRFAVFNCIRGCGGASVYDCTSGLCDAGEINGVAMCQVKCRVPCAPSTLTHHLNVLRDAGLISTEKRGRNVFAKVVPGCLDEISAFFSSQSPCSVTPEDSLVVASNL